MGKMMTVIEKLVHTHTNLFEELHHVLAVVPLWGVQGVEVVHVGAQLLHSTCSEGVTGRNEHSEVVLHQPECDLLGVEGRQ